MSSQPQSKKRVLNQNPLGTWLRALRHQRGLPLRAVAAEAEMDTALLSKIELGQRLPTERQTAVFAAFFGVPSEEMEAKRLAESFWMENKDNPAANKAAAMIKETAPAYASTRAKRNTPATNTPASDAERPNEERELTQ